MLQMTIGERHPSGRLVFNVRMQAGSGKLEFPISVDDQGTQIKNENAALSSAIELAEAFTVAARGRLAS
jgi:hypothetical protein